MAATSPASLSLVRDTLGATEESRAFDPSAMAGALFYLLRDRGAMDGLYVLGRLQSLFPDEPDDADQRWCVEALFACRADAPEKGLSRRRYDEWYAGREDKSVRPHSTDIRRIFGSWTSARSKVDGTPQADPRALRQLRRGPDCEPDRLIETLQAWKQELDRVGYPPRLTLDRFRAWARRMRKDPRCKLQLPLSHKPRKRLFGG